MKVASKVRREQRQMCGLVELFFFFFFCWGLARGTSQCLLKQNIYNINGNKKFIPAGHMINIKCKGNLKVKLFNLDSTCKVCFFNGEKLKIKK